MGQQGGQPLVGGIYVGHPKLDDGGAVGRRGGYVGPAKGLLLVLVLRPLGGMLTLARSSRTDLAERAVISFFGIRGIGSVYYLAYALDQADFPQARLLWAVLAFTRLLSITLHGIMATPVMNWLDHRHGRKTAAELTKSTAG